MEIFWEIVKICLPALIVFATAYFLLKTLLDNKYNGQIEALRRENAKIGLPLKLQAYERFTLLCERVDLGPLLIRLRSQESTATSLKMAMMMAINQEFEHNISQQMYVSETLWQILSLAREETYQIIQNSYREGMATDEYIDAVFASLNSIGGVSPFQKALSAIRTEVASIL